LSREICLKGAITKYLSKVQEVFEKYVKTFQKGPPLILSLVRAGIVVKIPRQRRGRIFRLWRNPGDPHEEWFGKSNSRTNLKIAKAQRSGIYASLRQAFALQNYFFNGPFGRTKQKFLIFQEVTGQAEVRRILRLDTPGKALLI
jgi:hypothetical protein